MFYKVNRQTKKDKLLIFAIITVGNNKFIIIINIIGIRFREFLMFFILIIVNTQSCYSNYE